MKYRTLRALIAPFTRLIFPTKIINLNNYTEGPKQAIYVSNHYTFFDTAPHITYLFKKEPVSILAKKEAFENKFFRKFLKATNAIAVNRDGKDSAAIFNTLKILKSGKSILIFPEGTRNKEGTRELLPLKDGVVGFSSKLDIPVVPIIFYKPLKPFRRNYMIIGKPINFKEIQDQNKEEFSIEKGTEILKQYMLQTRSEMDIMLDSKKVKIKQIEAPKK